MKRCSLILVFLCFLTRSIQAGTVCDALDSSTNHLDGTFVGNPLPDCVTGISGQAVRFDGAQNYVSVPNSPALYPQTSFTLETWLKTTTAGGNILGNLGAADGMAITINGDQHHAVFYGNFQGMATFGISNFTDVNDGNWHHVAYTWDAETGSLKAYTDGILGETKGTAGPIVPGELPFNIGQVNNSFATGPIIIDEVRLSSAVRYDGDFTPQHSFAVDDNTIGYWRFSPFVPPAPPSCSPADAMAHHHDGTFAGDPLPDCVAGVSGSAAELDGLQNYVSVPTDPALYPQGSFTLEGWWKTTLSGPGGTGHYLGTITPTDGYAITVNGDTGHTVFYARFQSEPIFGTSNFSYIGDGLWHHFAATWDGPTRVVSVFTDGVLGEQKITPGPLAAGNSPFLFGRTPNGFARQGAVAFDEVRLSSVVRYPTNFIPHHSFAVDTNTIAYWKFSECDSDTTAPAVACQHAPKKPSGKISRKGFYQLLATDDCDVSPVVYVKDTGSEFVAGPFAVGDVVRIKHTRGAASLTPGALSVTVILRLNGQGLAVAKDSAGNWTSDVEGCAIR